MAQSFIILQGSRLQGQQLVAFLGVLDYGGECWKGSSLIKTTSDACLPYSVLLANNFIDCDSVQWISNKSEIGPLNNAESLYTVYGPRESDAPTLHEIFSML